MAGGQEQPVGTIQSNMRVRIFLSISGLTDWLPHKLKAAHMAIWLGLLNESDLNEVTAASYDYASGFGSESHNLDGLWPWEEEVIRRIFPDCQSLLVAAAGGGREAIALAHEGFEVTAFDASEALTSACRANIVKAEVKATILDSEPDKVPSGLGVYDGLIMGRGSYHHIPGRCSRIRFLQECREHLSADAPVFLNDFHALPTVSKGIRRTASIASFVRRIRRSQESIEIGDQLNSDNFYHRFRREEIATELHEAGFQLESFTATPFGDGANLAYAVAKATSGH
jgi:2-polyprenyl-3-methyl-5-hydroxy-6-metoxy-1,4-benzoquinol methylase